MSAEDFTPRRVTLPNGRVAIATCNPEIRSRLSELDCGRWSELADAATFTTRVLGRIEPKGFALSPLERAALRRAREGGELGADQEFELLGRAMAWVNANAPVGYHLGFKLGDLWFMPTCWWEDTGGDERHSPGEA